MAVKKLQGKENYIKVIIRNPGAGHCHTDSVSAVFRVNFIL